MREGWEGSGMRGIRDERDGDRRQAQAYRQIYRYCRGLTYCSSGQQVKQTRKTAINHATSQSEMQQAGIQLRGAWTRRK